MTPLAQGLLVVFEGIDGAGKTTQAAALAANLRQLGLEVVETKEPTAGPWGTKLRASAATGRLGPTEELELFLRDRQEHVDTVIRPGLNRGAVVIVDRYFLSTAAYQGARGGNPEQILLQNEAFAPAPDVLFLLQVPPSVGRQRIAARGDVANLFESQDGLAAAAKIFDAILRPYIVRLDGTMPIPVLAATILIGTYEGHVVDRLPGKQSNQVVLDAAHTTAMARSIAEDASIPLDKKAERLVADLLGAASQSR